MVAPAGVDPSVMAALQAVLQRSEAATELRVEQIEQARLREGPLRTDCEEARRQEVEELRPQTRTELDPWARAVLTAGRGEGEQGEPGWG